MKYGNDEGQGKVMDNPILESLTKTPIWLPLTVYYGAGTIVLLVGLIWGILGVKFNPIIAIPVWVIGFFSFTFIEYVAHRYVFHMKAETEKKKRIAYMFHGVHHDYPRDKDRLSMPIFISVILASAFFALFYFTMGIYGFAFGGGFIVGYATYLFTHYAIHRFKPPKNFLKQLWIHHNIHHYASPNAAFGVSTLVWDRIFGTMPKQEVEK